MSGSPKTYALRLPSSVKAEVVRLAKADGISVNQFIATAVAEKLAAMNTATFFAERRERADFEAFAAGGVLYFCVERPFLVLRDRIDAGVRHLRAT